MNEDAMRAAGCQFLLWLLLFSFVIQPFAYGGYVKNTYGITDMGYWQKWVGGGLSGIGLNLWISSLPLQDYRAGQAPPISPVERK